MKPYLYLFILFAIAVTGCNEEPAILPGLIKSQLVISTEPADATIFLNDDNLGKATPSQIDQLEPGFYKVTLKKDLYLDTTFYYIINRNVSDSLFFEMRENPSIWWANFSHLNSPMPNATISAILIDQSGVKWLATNGRGLVRVEPGEVQWNNYTSSNSPLPSDRVSSVIADRAGRLWIGTAEGLCFFDGVNWTVYDAANSGLTDEFVTALAIDKNNSVWIGTYSGGLFKYDGVRFTQFETDNSGLPYNNITALALDDAGLLYIGMYGKGMASFDGINWKVYNTSNSKLGSNYVRSFHFRSGKLYIAGGIATEPGGLTILDGTSMSFYNIFNSGLATMIATGVTTDQAGGIWVSSADAGLFYHNGKKWVSFSRTNSGLPSNSVTAVAIDAAQDKWISSTGLSKYKGRK